MGCKCGANTHAGHAQRITDGFPNHPKIDQVRCFQCDNMFDPYTNEWYCSDKCHGLAIKYRS